MEPSRGTPRGRRPSSGKNVGGRLALVGVLLVVVVGGMLLLSRLASWLPGEPAKEPSPTAPAESTAKTEAEGGQAPATPAEPGEKAESAEPTAEEQTPAQPEGQGEKSAPVAEGTESPPEEAETAEKLPPWPRDADLPILKRYDIDWHKGETLLQDVRDKTYEFAGSVSDAAAFYWLVRTAKKLPRQAFVPDPPTKETGYQQLVSMPGMFRGVAVSVSGVVSNVVEWGIPRPEVTGVKRFWIVEFFRATKGDLAEVMTLVLVDEPVGIDVGMTIRTKAYFYKIRTYEAEHYVPEVGENRAFRYESPLLVGRYAVPVVSATAPRSSRGDLLLLFSLIGLLVLGAAVLFFIRRILSQRDLYRIREQEELTDEEMGRRVDYLKDLENDRSL